MLLEPEESISGLEDSYTKDEKDSNSASPATPLTPSTSADLLLPAQTPGSSGEATPNSSLAMQAKRKRGRPRKIKTEPVVDAAVDAVVEAAVDAVVDADVQLSEPAPLCEGKQFV